ncbi:unnamed protein product, partial [Cyprideis torosa]
YLQQCSGLNSFLYRSRETIRKIASEHVGFKASPGAAYYQWRGERGSFNLWRVSCASDVSREQESETKSLEWYEGIEISAETCLPCLWEILRGKHSLNIHERTHTGVKPFQCEFCKKMFSRLGNSTQHRRSHSVEKAFQCNRSQKPLRTHMGETPFECVVCSKRLDEDLSPPGSFYGQWFGLCDIYYNSLKTSTRMARSSTLKSGNLWWGEVIGGPGEQTLWVPPSPSVTAV